MNTADRHMTSGGVRRTAGFRRYRLAVLVGAALALAAGRWCMGGQVRPVEVPGARAMLAQFADRMEREIAQRMMKRPDTPPDRLAQLELEIDLRIIAQWFAAQALAAVPGSDHQAVCHLRARLVAETAAALEETAQQGAKPSAGAVAAMAAIHKLTYALAEVRGPRDMDDVSRRLGQAVLALAQVDEKSIVLPRPRPLKVESPASVAGRPAGTMSLADELRALNVSVPLRQQLLLLAAAASAPHTGDAQKDREAAALGGVVVEALELARGLSANIGVAPEVRVQLEGQLAEAIALYMDPRTRAAGANRMASLGQYRNMLARIERMKLGGERMAQFGPFLAWCRERGEYGEKALTALERYVAYRARFEARRKQPSPMPQVQRSIEELEKQFAQAGTMFVMAAVAIPRSAATTQPVADLSARADEVKRILDNIERLDSVGPAMEAIAPFKPRPTGALERRIALAAAALSATGNAPARAEGAKFLDQVIELHRAISEMARLTASDIPSPLEKRWAGGKLADLDAKWREAAAEAASSLATAGELNRAKLARMGAALELYDALKQAVRADQTLVAGGAHLAKWVDWRMTLEDLKLLLSPYRQAMADAFSGHVLERGGWESAWRAAERRWRPLVAMINRIGAYSDQCATFPAGVALLGASLMTPMEAAPFGAERFAGFAAAAWKHLTAAGESEQADEALLVLARRIGWER